jgi:hypothetical protein
MTPPDPASTLWALRRLSERNSPSASPTTSDLADRMGCLVHHLAEPLRVLCQARAITPARIEQTTLAATGWLVCGAAPAPRSVSPANPQQA